MQELEKGDTVRLHGFTTSATVEHVQLSSGPVPKQIVTLDRPLSDDHTATRVWFSDQLAKVVK